MNGVEYLKFLGELKKNNNRPWFEENKPWFRDTYQNFIELVSLVIDKLGDTDADLALLEPKKCVFRIYRDVRFSKDKSPYKTNFGAWINRGGKQAPTAGYYFQISPGESFIGGGLYHPEPKLLAMIRQEIDYNGQDLLKILNSKPVSKYYSGLWDGDRLKRPPKGYDADNEFIDYLKNKSFVAMHSIPDVDIRKKDLESRIAEPMMALQPFIEYLNTAISDDY